MTQHAKEEIGPIGLDGDAPRSLAFSDGSELTLDENTESWRRGSEELSVGDAVSVAGQANANYVKTRTRAEVAWLFILAEWCQDRAERLARDLDRAAA